MLPAGRPGMGEALRDSLANSLIRSYRLARLLPTLIKYLILL